MTGSPEGFEPTPSAADDRFPPSEPILHEPPNSQNARCANHEQRQPILSSNPTEVVILSEAKDPLHPPPPSQNPASPPFLHGEPSQSEMNELNPEPASAPVPDEAEAQAYQLETALSPAPEPKPAELYHPTLRTPNLADVLVFLLLLILGFLISTGALAIALHVHLFGLRNFAQAQGNTAVALGTELIIYLSALVGALPFFSMAWDRRFFDALQWRARTALSLWWVLGCVAILCNLLAVLVDQVVPYPEHAPIDKLFTTTSDAWLLMAFGVTVAPFFEELIFRGFLLPAVASAWDWCAERMAGVSPPPPDSAGNQTWSRAAMVIAALTVSAPFALMHSDQVAHSWGPLILLYCVSLTLCMVRFWTRSLAASTLTHSIYNLILFSMMLVQTDGFRHLEKM